MDHSAVYVVPSSDRRVIPIISSQSWGDPVISSQSQKPGFSVLVNVEYKNGQQAEQEHTQIQTATTHFDSGGEETNQVASSQTDTQELRVSTFFLLKIVIAKGEDLKK